MPADPTQQTLADLADPGKFARLAAVPVLAPFRRANADGSVDEVTPAMLPAICRRMQALDAAGNAVTLTHGHIKPAADERDQPELLGLYRSPRLGTLADGKPAILMDRYAFADRAELVRRLPHRSSEYYPKSGVVKGVAALVRPPQIDMGVVCLDGQEQPVCLSLGDELMTPEPPVKLEEVGESPVLLQLQERVVALEQSLADERAGRDADHCDAVLLALQAEGYVLNTDERAEERGELLSLPRDRRERYAAKLRKVYADRKVPDGPMLPVQSGEQTLPDPDADDPSKKPDYYDAAERHMLANPGMGWNQAVAAVTKK